MARQSNRAKFTTEPRSISRERYDVEAAQNRGRSGVRSSSFSTDEGDNEENQTPSKPGLKLPSAIGEEEAEETDAFLPGTSLSNSRSGGLKSMLRLPLLPSYGSFSHDRHDSHHPARFLQLNMPQDGLRRNESILKLQGLIDDKGGEYEKFRMSEEKMKELKMSKKVKEFYREQNEILDAFQEVDAVLDNTRILASTGLLGPIIPSKVNQEKEEAYSNKVKLVINVNFLINFFLLAAKIMIVIFSNSVSLLASTVDSAMDFLSTLIIWGTSRVVEHKNWKDTYNYPTGKRRMEPMGVVVFSVFMIASFVQVLIESVEKLLDKDLTPAEIPFVGIIVMVSTIAVKGMVWVWCRSIKNSSVEALTQDAENDIVFNFFSILFPYVGQKLGWRYLDPLGGALLSIYIIVEWVSTLLETVRKLSGKRASPLHHQRVAYMLTRFSTLIQGIQHLSVYHTGDSYIVEVDVVLPSSTSLTTAHAVGESSQYALEQLDGIERAFVHVDITFNQLSGHLER